MGSKRSAGTTQGGRGTSYGLHSRHPRGQAEPAATAIMGKPGAKGHAARGSAADPVCGMLCAKCEMPLHMKQTPAGRVVSHSLTTHTTTREWLFYLPIRTYSLNWSLPNHLRNT